MARKEIWKRCIEFDELEVSNLGNIRRRGGKLLRSAQCKDAARITFACQANGKVVTRTVKSLVAHAHVPNPDGLRFACLRDGNKANCKASNLYWWAGGRRSQP